MMNNKRSILLIALSLLLAGCGELSYKRGAGLAELISAQSACKKEGGDYSAYEKCMTENGWVVHSLDDTFPVATVTANNGIRAESSDANTSSNKAVSGAINKKVLDNPLDVFTISSWWKTGGQSNQLGLSIEECVTKLGAEHRPSSDNRRVTRGLLLCLRQQNWYGLRDEQ